jgi:positive regulator of sigma E activity
MHRRAWLAGLLLYGLGASADFAYHLVDDLRTGDRVIELSEIAVAFSAALFWPVDLVAMALLAGR